MCFANMCEWGEWYEWWVVALSLLLPLGLFRVVFGLDTEPSALHQLGERKALSRIGTWILSAIEANLARQRSGTRLRDGFKNF